MGGIFSVQPTIKSHVHCLWELRNVREIISIWTRSGVQECVRSESETVERVLELRPWLTLDVRDWDSDVVSGSRPVWPISHPEGLVCHEGSRSIERLWDGSVRSHNALRYNSHCFYCHSCNYSHSECIWSILCLIFMVSFETFFSELSINHWLKAQSTTEQLFPKEYNLMCVKCEYIEL